jgi:hypothetical protein
MAFTPGTAQAAVVSNLRIRAWGWGLRSILPVSMPGKMTSAVYRVSPVTLSGPSMRLMDCPMISDWKTIYFVFMSFV